MPYPAEQQKENTMWIFCQNGFFSIVEHRDDPKLMVVRARLDGDIQRYWPDAKVSATPERDYLYRAFIPKKKVADAVSRMASDIDYDNFKANISDKRRGHWYMEVWEAMVDMQQSVGSE